MFIKFFVIFVFGIYLLIWFLEIFSCFAVSIIRKGKRRSEETGEKKTENKSKLKNNIIACLNGIEKITIYRVSRIPSHALRNQIYKHIFGMNLQSKVVIYSQSIFRKPSSIYIDRGTVIGDRCELDGRGVLRIGANCNLSSEVHIWTAQHNVQSPDFAFVKAEVVVGDRCWISSNTVILPGVHMGEGSVLAAGAVLTKDTEPYGIYAGVPAKKIGERNKNLQYEFDGSHDWFM